ncbi:9472_t:CDS:2, partial [Ambispora leptoticha]
VKKSTMYIPITDMAENLDVIKAVADLKLTISLGQLFKWSPKVRSEIMKALTRKKKEIDVTNVDVRLRLVKGSKMRETMNEIVPIWPALINGDLVDVPIDPGSRLNLMHINYAKKRGLTWEHAYGKGRMADDRISEFIGYIPQVKVEMEGVVTNQGFYIMESASFDVLLGMPWLASAQSSFIVSVVPQNWNEEKGDHGNWDEARDLQLRKIEGQLELTEPMFLRRLTWENIHLLNFGPDLLSEEKQYVMSRLINEVSKTFAFKLSELGRTNLVKYEVRTGDMEVPHMRLRPVRINNPEKALLFEEHLKEMIQYGLLEEGNGPYAYHCFPIDKKEGRTDRIRTVSIMRPLNKHIIKDGYPLPIIRDILEKAVDHKWYSSVNAFKRYWQIRICEKDRDKVAVSMTLGVLRYTVMCMGLKNASKTFQRLMDLVLKENEWKGIAAAYQDDVGLWTDGDLEEHIDVFIKLAKTFEKAGLTFAAKKCYVGYKKLSMYGFIVSKSGIKVDKKGLKRIQHWPEPSNPSEVRLFHGTVGYYRRFIRNFSKIAGPITDLMKKDYVCDVSVGAVLEQDDGDGNLRPLTFDSRKLNKHELNYTVTEKECLAIIFGCNVNERYVGGTIFNVWVDHQALEWLFNKAELKERLMHWVLALQAFKFKVCYKNGKRHGNADRLSRYPKESMNETVEDEEFVDGMIMRVDMINNKVKDLLWIKNYLENFAWPRDVKEIDLPHLQCKMKRYCVIRDNLYKRSKDGVPPKRVIFDNREKYDILAANHIGTAEEEGHHGINGTARKVLMNYSWGSGNVYNDAAKYVKSCIECQKYSNRGHYYLAQTVLQL